MDESTTTYKVYMAQALEDLADNNVMLKVSVPELLPAASGKMTPADEPGAIATTSSSGLQETSRVTTSNHLVASWYGESNRKYPPTVRVGEQVEVIKFSDGDKYYWRSIGRDPKLRREDTYRVEVTARSAGGSPPTDDDTYFLEMDSKKKRVVIKTSNVNGEACRYVFSIDGSSGVVTLGDSLNNSIIINSQTPSIQITNGDKTHVTIIKDKAIIDSPKDVIINSAQTITAISQEVTVQAKTIKLDGNVTITGNLTTEGSTTGGSTPGSANTVKGDLVVEGATTHDGPTTFNGGVTGI